MLRQHIRIGFCFFVLTLSSFQALAQVSQSQLGAAQLSKYLHLIENRSVDLVVNQTATVDDTHLVDMLLAKGVDVRTVFAPEHGFRGNKGAGEIIQNGIDPSTQLPIVSLYGKQKKPTQAMLTGIDVIIFDIQDVGVRFYTYISTMHYVMEAAAEFGIPMIVLDRPNPNIAHIAGPVLDLNYQSFVGMHPIPILHGLTVGELALMIKGEGWIERAETLSLTVIPVAKYSATDTYDLPIAPSPNLPNASAIQFYASLCLFEPTTFSVGRGTSHPFQIVGHPRIKLSEQFQILTPISMPNSAPFPKWQDQAIYATLINQTHKTLKGFDLTLIKHAFTQSQLNDEAFFTSPDFFDKLAGTSELRMALGDRDKLSALEQKWQYELEAYKVKAEKYFLYSRVNLP